MTTRANVKTTGLFTRDVFFARVRYYHHYCYRPQAKFAKVMFLHLSVCSGGWCLGPGPGGGWGIWPGGRLGGLTLGCVQAYTKGEEDPGPGLGGVQGQGGVSQHALRQTPPSKWLLLQAVRILLECILV